MKISKTLQKLAKEFEKKNCHLYIVGGFVRDSLLGYNPQDIDITSSMRIEDVEKICQKLKFKCKIINKHLGTLLISAPKEKYEYTTFRKESYARGMHSPDKVEFVDDIKLDALRRDFTINALYYDIANDEIIDLLGGKKDLEQGIIRTCNDPMITLKDDGLRILRCIRFASTYNFKFDKKTYQGLRHFRQNLLNISKERIVKELKLMVVADMKFGIYNNIFWDAILDLKLLPLIFNRALVRMRKIPRRIIRRFYLISEKNRLTTFYMAVLDHYIHRYTKPKQLKFIVNMLFGLDGIKESNETIRLLEKLYLIYENVENNIDIMNASICYLGLTNGNREMLSLFYSDKANRRLTGGILLIQGRNLPLSLDELNISAQDLLDAKIDERYISQILVTLFNQVINFKVQNEKSELLACAIAINEAFLDLANKERNKK